MSKKGSKSTPFWTPPLWALNISSKIVLICTSPEIRREVPKNDDFYGKLGPKNPLFLLFKTIKKQSILPYLLLVGPTFWNHLFWDRYGTIKIAKKIWLKWPELYLWTFKNRPWCEKGGQKTTQKGVKIHYVLAIWVIFQKAIFLSMRQDERENWQKWPKNGQKRRFCKNGLGQKVPL